MRISKFLITTIASMAALTTYSHADTAPEVTNPTTVNGTSLHFSGKFINAACSVDVNNEGQVVSLGEYRAATYGKGDGKISETASIPFSIKITDCDTTVSQSASIAFQGVAATDEKLFATSANSNNISATGVAIELRDSDNTVLSPAGNFSKEHKLIDGDNTLMFTARYKAIADKITAGQANTDAIFIVSYK